MTQSELLHLFPASFDAEIMLQPHAAIGTTGTSAGALRRMWGATPSPEGIALYTQPLPASADVTLLLTQDPPTIANSLTKTSVYLSGTTKAKGVTIPWAPSVQAPTLSSYDNTEGVARTIAALKLIAELGGSTTLAPRTASTSSATLAASYTHDGKTGPVVIQNVAHLSQEKAILKAIADFIEDYNSADNFGDVEMGAVEANYIANIDFEAHPLGTTYRLSRFPVGFYNNAWYVITAEARKAQLALANASTLSGWTALDNYIKQVTRGETPSSSTLAPPSMASLWALTKAEQDAAMDAYAAFASAKLHAQIDATAKPAISLSPKAAALSAADQKVVKGLMAAGYTKEQIDAYIDAVEPGARVGDWLATAAAADVADGAGAATLAAFEAFKAANPSTTETFWSWSKDKLWPVTKDSLSWLGDTTVSAISKGVDVTADIAKDWGPTGTIAAVSATKALTDDTLGKYTPWIIGAVALLLIK